MKPYIIAILIGIALSIALTVMTGCAMNKSTETYTVDGIEYTLTVEQWLFLYWSKTKQIDIRSPLSSVGVGEIDTKPDPNSIEAAGGLVGSVIKAVIEP